MEMCGYHLRCLNLGDHCSECRHQHKDKNADHFRDVLSPLCPDRPEIQDPGEVSGEGRVNEDCIYRTPRF
jgi:hypothetical protein